MLGSALSSPTAPVQASSTNPATSPTRPSRLRRLSYLRAYTQSHLLPLSRESPPAVVRSTSSPGQDTPATPSHEHRANVEDVQSGTDEGATFSSTNLASTSSARSIMDTGDELNAVPPPQQQQHQQQLPTIRLIPHLESRSSRPSLHFTALSRTLSTATSVVRVGRYSERDHTTLNTNTAAAASSPVGFKSKVVSRRHCEFWHTAGQWYIKDVKSSSGTFLNHVRLSPPGVESRPFPVNDGDVVQLGIDFKGGEEVIFRCVKIRVECGRGWQKGLNNYNTAAHRRLLMRNAGLASSQNGGDKRKNKKVRAEGGAEGQVDGENGLRRRESDALSAHSSECSICLNAVAPCQALFVAPCSHVWHFKCVRDLIQGPSWPNFLCPNCRFVADLEADVEPLEEEEGDFLENDFVEEGAGEEGMEILSQAGVGGERDEPGSAAEYNTQHPGVQNDDRASSALIGNRGLVVAHQDTAPILSSAPRFDQSAANQAFRSSPSLNHGATHPPPMTATNHDDINDNDNDTDDDTDPEALAVLLRQITLQPGAHQPHQQQQQQQQRERHSNPHHSTSSSVSASSSSSPNTSAGAIALNKTQGNIIGTHLTSHREQHASKYLATAPNNSWPLSSVTGMGTGMEMETGTAATGPTQFAFGTAADTAAERGAGIIAEGPLTPRNDAGPFVLDGSGRGGLGSGSGSWAGERA